MDDDGVSFRGAGLGGGMGLGSFAIGEPMDDRIPAYDGRFAM